METIQGVRTWHWRPTDWAAAAVSGFAAGGVLMVLDLLWSSLYDPDGPWRTSHMIAPIFIGTGPLATTGYGFSVAVVSVALLTHYAVGILFGLVIAAVMAQLRADGTPGRAAATGAILGLALYLLNFDVLVAVFPWLAELQGLATLAAHVVFGVVAGVLYWRLKRTASEP